jgi:hypothetical protein
MSDPTRRGYGYAEREDPPSRVVPFGTPDPRVNAPPSAEPRKTSVGVDLARTGFLDYGGQLVPTASDALGRLASAFFAKSITADPDHLDSIPDGLLYGKAVITALIDGLIDFAGIGVVNKFAEHLLRQPGGAALVDIIAQLTDGGHAGSAFEDFAGRQLRLFLAKGLPGDPDTFDGLEDGALYRKQLPQLTIGMALVSANATSVTVLVVAVDPYGGLPALTWDPTASVTDNGDDTFTIARNSPGGGPRRITFTATLTNRLDAVEAIDVPEQEGSGPDLDVRVATGPTSSSITWGGDNVELSIDGAAYATPPASPISVSRNAAGGAFKEYTFRGTANGQSVTNIVTIPPLDADTVTPNLTVVPATPGATSQEFTVTGSNPKAGGSPPTLSVRPRGTDGSTLGYGGLTAGVEVPIPDGDVVTINRPASGAAPATVEFTASLTGGGIERIQRTVLPQGFGPSLEVSPTELATTVSIAWDAIGAVDYRIDGGSWTTPPASPFSVSRNSAGGDAKTVEIRATLDSQAISTYVIVRPQDAGGGSVPASIPALYVTEQDNAADTITIVFAVENAPGGYTLDLAWSRRSRTSDDGAEGVITGISTTSPYVFDTDTHDPNVDLVPKFTTDYVAAAYTFTLRLKNGSTVIATATTTYDTYAVITV